MTEQSKEKRILKELSRLKKLFSEVDGNQRSIVLPLLQNAAFMAITLQDLQESIIKTGTTDVYKNGEHQTGIKQSAELQAFNATIKNYAALIKALSKLLPPEKQPEITYSFQKPAPLEPSELEKEHQEEMQGLQSQLYKVFHDWEDELKKRQQLEKELQSLKEGM